MSSRITIGIAGTLALVMCFASMRDVPHNDMIKNPESTMTILRVAVAVIIVAGVLALIRGSRKMAIISLLASGFGILFSLVLACV
jgi:hypothetical protein